MSNEDTQEPDAPKKRSKLPLLIGVILALAGGGGGYYAVDTGLLFGTEQHEADDENVYTDHEMPDVSFVAIDPIVVTLAAGDRLRHLRFSAQLEVPPSAKSRVEALLPRVVDVFNSYLRAVEIADLEDPTALLRFRSHLLRRAQLVLGDDAVRNLLIMEFVLNQ